MPDIPWQPADPISQCISGIYREINDCKQTAENKSKQTRYNTPDQKFFFDDLFEQQYDQDKERPDIEVGYPPGAEPPLDQFKQIEYCDYEESFLAKNQRI